MSRFSKDRFHDEDAARAYLESVLWPDGRICPHCGTVNHAYATKRAGVYRCAEKGCRKDFTVTMKTVMERSHIALHKWMQAFHLMTASKKGISAHQLHRTLNITYEAAWFMAHRIREAMRAGGLEPLGGEGKIVEADETYYGRVEKPRTHTTTAPPFTKSGKTANKRPIVALVERGGRSAHSMSRSPTSTPSQDRWRKHRPREPPAHGRKPPLSVTPLAFRHPRAVKHSAGEYVRGDVHTNTAEGYFSIFKRGMRGVYQHCDEKHLHRYLAEFDFRYNNLIALGVNDGNVRR